MKEILFPIGLSIFLLALIALIMLFNERHVQHQRLITEHQQALGLPEGELVYEDADGQGETLSSSDYPLIGKPDYIVKQDDGRLVPIVLKLNVRDASAPAPNHEILIATYCLILEDYAETPPIHGIVRYADREFVIEYTPALRKKVLRLLGDIEQYTAQRPPPLTKQKVTKCRACIFQPICPVGRGK